MKNTFFLLLLFFSTFGFSQSTCLDFSNYDNSYLNDVTFDDVTYPIGSPFMSSGDIRLIKYDNSFYKFIDTVNNQMCYIGVIGVDLTTSNYSCKSLTFNLIAGINVIIDGDTNAVASGASYSNANWNMTMSSGSPMLVTITGDFDLVEINNSTTCISNICLASCSTNSSCIDFSNYDNSYLNDVTSDDITYPVGSAFISSGDLNLVKYDNTFYQFIDTVNNRMCYIGALGMDVANAPYSCRILTFELIAGVNVIVDGDTNIVSAGANYTNTNWNMTMSSGSPMLVTITGNFDLVTVNSSTICISNICLSSCSSNSSCIDFSDYSNSYIDQVTVNDTVYPVGTSFMTSGDIHIIKEDNSFYQFIDTTLNQMCYFGALGIDVANAAYSCKTLSFGVIGAVNVVVDGVSNPVSSGANYSNPNWTLTMGSGSPIQIEITGDFDLVKINNSTTCVSNICLASCDSTAGIENENNNLETVFDIYPNPINDKLHINIESKNYSVSVFDLQGNKVMSASDLSDAEELSVSDLKSGMYLICVELEDGSVLTKRVVKN
ncbi:MAG: T9SS type A sorting domain-containing protein [Fluviicola sp.]